MACNPYSRRYNHYQCNTPNEQYGVETFRLCNSCNESLNHINHVLFNNHESYDYCKKCCSGINGYCKFNCCYNNKLNYSSDSLFVIEPELYLCEPKRAIYILHSAPYYEKRAYYRLF